MVKPDNTLLLIGTMKGAFIFRSDANRQEWSFTGPHFPGHAVYAMAYDDRDSRNRLWASISSMHWGAVLCSSDNFGETWLEPETAPVRFPEDTGKSLNQIWQIATSPTEKDVLYCGVEPAALFRSEDAGENWSLVRGLFNHPDRSKWEPGGGGLCLHTIVPDPNDRERITIAISTGGVYATEDGGETWKSKNKGVRAEFLPDKYPEFGQCVHKIVMNRQAPGRLFLQNHWGLYRSDDYGENWTDVANGVPSDFGFAMAADHNDRDTAFIIPLHSDQFRCTPDGRLRVYRTTNAGAEWEPLSNGLPQEHAFETVLRDGLATDEHESTGVYFGTRSGKVYASPDRGDSWVQVVDGLPPVTCVKATVIKNHN
jgi:hypothetical protein